MKLNYRDDTLNKMCSLKAEDAVIADKITAYSNVQLSIAYLDPLTNTYVFLQEAKDFPLSLSEASELLLARISDNLHRSKLETRDYLKRLAGDLNCALMEE